MVATAKLLRPVGRTENAEEAAILMRTPSQSRSSTEIDSGPRPVLRLGDSRLRLVCSAPPTPPNNGLQQRIRALHATLDAFRAHHGFGRAIAAPQVGFAERFVAARLGERSLTLLDPRITWWSAETFELWDDCMSFPDLLVRVRRHCSISVSYYDENGASQSLDRLPRDLAELFQHELDHLDGVLAVDRAIGADALRLRPGREGESTAPSLASTPIE